MCVFLKSPGSMEDLRRRELLGEPVGELFRLLRLCGLARHRMQYGSLRPTGENKHKVNQEGTIQKFCLTA